MDSNKKNVRVIERKEHTTSSNSNDAIDVCNSKLLVRNHKTATHFVCVHTLLLTLLKIPLKTIFNLQYHHHSRVKATAFLSTQSYICSPFFEYIFFVCASLSYTRFLPLHSQKKDMSVCVCVAQSNEFY